MKKKDVSIIVSKEVGDIRIPLILRIGEPKKLLKK